MFVKRLLDLLILSCLLILVLQVAGRFGGPHAYRQVWEDSSMLARYADNLLRYHSLIWNPGGEPTYGLTAPYFLFVVLPMRALIPSLPILSLTLASLFCGCVFVALLLLSLKDRVSMLVASASLAVASSDLIEHFLSGMDTMFALAFITLYIWVAQRMERTGSDKLAVLLGILGGLAFGCRPDLMIFTTIVPAAVFVFGSRRRGALILGLTLGVLALELACAAWYLHSPVPLPFYAKVLHLYDGFFGYKLVPYHQLWNFLVAYRFAFVILALTCWRLPSAVDKGLLAATAVFIVYYLFFVLQIMQMNQRFYYPALPAILILACQGVRRIIPTLEWRAWRLAAAALWLALLPMQIDAAQSAIKLWRSGFASFDTLNEYVEYWGDGWYRLDDFSKLPDDLVMATTELGHPGILNMGKVVIDLSGLNETGFARQKFSADALFRKYQPDLIYIPPPNYQGMLRNLLANSYFTSEYDYYPERTLSPLAMGVAVRRSSKYYRQMHEIVTGPHVARNRPGAVYRDN